jgi:hypothetical protein
MPDSRPPLAEPGRAGMAERMRNDIFVETSQ